MSLQILYDSFLRNRVRAVVAVVSVIATSFMPDYTGQDISQEHSFAAAST